MVWVDEWRGDRLRSRLCVRQFPAEGTWSGKKVEIVSSRPEHQKETHLLKRRISVDDLDGLLSWIKSM